MFFASVTPTHRVLFRSHHRVLCQKLWLEPSEITRLRPLRKENHQRLEIFSKMASLKRFSCDDETGEVITYQVNEETGERAVINELPNIYTFDRLLSTRKVLRFPSGYASKTKKFQDLKEKIITGANTTSPRMLLLIPTLMIFSSLVCVMLMLLEIFLHIRCHKKNKNLKDTNLYYRSPFHVLTSTFCGWCRECDMASKIGQIQDKRRYKYDYLRGAL